jgi:hypothetical protein
MMIGKIEPKGRLNFNIFYTFINVHYFYYIIIIYKYNYIINYIKLTKYLTNSRKFKKFFSIFNSIWISPHLPQLPNTSNSSDGDSLTEFKKYFRKYLSTYEHPQIRKWEHLIKRADFSAVNVFFVASVPGSHKSLNLNSWGHRRLATILTEYAVLPSDASKWTLVAQCSSIGSLGANYESWVSSNIVESMSKEKTTEFKNNPNFNLIYPSLKNFKESFDCETGSCCLPYARKNHEKQEWLKNYLWYKHVTISTNLYFLSDFYKIICIKKILITNHKSKVIKNLFL